MSLCYPFRARPVDTRVFHAAPVLVRVETDVASSHLSVPILQKIHATTGETVKFVGTFHASKIAGTWQVILIIPKARNFHLDCIDSPERATLMPTKSLKVA